jgi:hypothetical protein
VFPAVHEMEASEFYCDGAYCDLKFAVYDDRSRENADDELSSLSVCSKICVRRICTSVVVRLAAYNFAFNIKDYKISFREIIEIR